MYLIDPIAVTAKNGVLVSSSVAYPDAGINPENTDGNPVSRPRWARGLGYVYDALTPLYVVHHGALYQLQVSVPAAPANSTPLQLPPGHTQNDAATGGAWLRINPPIDWSASVDDTEGVLVAFPAATYPLLSTDPALTAEQKFDLASTPDFGAYAGYPSGIWRRNAVLDDSESILPKVPSLASKYWDAMEPPHFARYPEIPLGELTTFGGRVWRKRTAVMAQFEAPPSAPLDWALVKASNRFAMFDASVQSQTRQTRGSHVAPADPARNETITVALQIPAGRTIDAVAMLNLDATSVRVRVTSADDPPVVLYDRTKEMVTTSMLLSNWYDWFFAPRYRQRSLLLDDIPASRAALVTITITDAGGQAACGCCIVGKRIELGATLAGVSLGIKDYSVKAEDDFGNVTVTQRGYSDRASLPVLIANELLEPVKQTLIDFRARPALWVGSANLPSTIIYGFYKALIITVPYPTMSNYTLDIEGLT